jgi:adenylate cyclase
MSGHSEYFATIGKSMLLLLSGIGAAFVAHQIKLRVDRSLLAAEQSNKIVNLFGQQVSKEVVEEMMEKGGAVQTKIMHVCIMFIDIRNFTGYVADKTPEEIVAYQNAFFEIIVQCVIKHNGIINQFLGDGCMVTFGAPVSLSNPGTNAIHAALEIKQQLNKEIAKGNLPLTNIGIGIHEGSAVTGNIGPEIRQQYSITGSVVILAARIEQLNKQYNSQILISDSVFNKLEINIASEYIGKVNLKGWSNAVGIYKVA